MRWPLFYRMGYVYHEELGEPQRNEIHSQYVLTQHCSIPPGCDIQLAVAAQVGFQWNKLNPISTDCRLLQNLYFWCHICLSTPLKCICVY